MPKESLEKDLILTFSTEAPKLYLVPEKVGDEFFLNDVKYKDEVGDDGKVGLDIFYDWLRSSRRHIIGIRLNPVGQRVSNLLTSVSSHPYVEDKKGNLEVFFSQERNYKDPLSCDQSFGDRLFVGEDNSLAIYFFINQVDGLKKTDFNINLEELPSNRN